MIVEAEGWTKISMEKMRKLDSFMKESHRLNGSGFGKKIVTTWVTIQITQIFFFFSVTTRRLAMNDFSFSDGLFIPKGTSFVVAGRGINQDEVNFSSKIFKTLDGTQGISSGITTTRKNSKGSVLLIRIL